MRERDLMRMIFLLFFTFCYLLTYRLGRRYEYMFEQWKLLNLPSEGDTLPCGQNICNAACKPQPTYSMSMKSCPIFIVYTIPKWTRPHGHLKYVQNLLHKNIHDFLDTQFYNRDRDRDRDRK